jgi:outer membrane protein OmpA-like peptidoglycan-associated protein
MKLEGGPLVCIALCVAAGFAGAVEDDLTKTDQFRTRDGKQDTEAAQAVTLETRGGGRAERLELIRLPRVSDMRSVGRAFEEQLARADQSGAQGAQPSGTGHVDHVFGVSFRIRFAPGTAQFEPGEEAQVDLIAGKLTDLLRHHRMLSFEWRGPLDAGQDCRGAQALSAERAENLAASLEMRGVPGQSLIPAGQRPARCTGSAGEEIEPGEAIVVLRPR